MAVKMAGTKSKIMHLLKQKQELSVCDLANVLQMTKMGVRKHLTVLIKDGLVHVENKKGSVGRPVQIFSLGERAENLFPKNYGPIAVQFLKDIEELYGEQAVIKLFERRKTRLFLEYEQEMGGETVREAKASKLNELQKTRGYMSQLHKINDATYELIEYNCPIFEVAGQFKIACMRETELIKDVLGTDTVERTMCRADGATHCRFLIRFKNM